MGEKVQLAAKKPEVKRENPASHKRNAGKSQSMSSPIDGILFLQRTIGNQAVQRLIKSGTLQAKLRIGQLGDVYEQEADRVADAVMRMPEPQVAFGGAPHIQRACPMCVEEELQRQPIEEEEEELLQTKEISEQNVEATPDLESRINSIRGGGQPLTESERSFFEPRFGYDFSKVRVHTDAKAVRSVNAHAFTLSHNIIFGSGQYQPETNEGRQLLAHELTHVIQQEVSSVEPHVQRTFYLHELLTPQRTARRSNPVATSPDTYFYPGSTRNTSNRRAMVVAGIHGTEVSARQLGTEINSQLSRGSHTDFHAIVIPRANPTRSRGAGSRRAGTYVSDLNREFGAGYRSSNPYAQRIASIVREFDPERILSVHAISSTPLAGIFLDPIHTGAYPRVGTETGRRRAFIGDPDNLEAMRLTEAMICQVGTGGRYTRGNVPRRQFPRSEYPTPPGGRSAYSLIYPQQSQVSRSLGTWASSLGKTVITIEIPGYRAIRAVWSAFLPAVWRFLQIPAPAPTPVSSTMGHPIQPKLKVGPPRDRYEQEADRVAEAVMRMSEPEIQRQEEEGQEEEMLQAKSRGDVTSEVTNDLESQINAIKGGGRPLVESERAFFEPSFGYDFSRVRVHADAESDKVNQSLNARAFTMSRDIFFRQGTYSPPSKQGRELLTHELTHVVQQSGKSIYPTIQRISTISHVPYSIQRNNQITEENLPSPTERGLTRSEQEYRTFMREVYRRQVAIWLAQGATYVHEVVATERVELPTSYTIGRGIFVKPILESSTLSMIDDVRAALRTANAPGGPAADVDNIAIRSGYRSARSQFGIWTRWAPEYYRQTFAERQALPGGEHGPAAAQRLAEYTNDRVFSPGYSPHQRAEALDLSYHYRPGRAPPGTENGWTPASSDQTWIMTWRRSWLFHWLWENAPNYGFLPNPNINEPWHWEFRPGTALVLRFLRWLLPMLDRLLETGWSARFEEQFARGRGPIGPEEGSTEGEVP
jgi:hypothetical protein